MGITIEQEDGKPVSSKETKGGAPARAPESTQMVAPNIRDVWQQFHRGSQLSQAAYDYVEEIVDTLGKKKDLSVSHHFITGQDMDAVVFTSSDRQNSLVIMFAETYKNTTADRPAADAFLAESQKHINDGSRLIDLVVVVKEDYALAKKMANHIERTMLAMTTGIVDDISLASFEGNYFRVNQNVLVGKELIDSLNPQASRPRTDITAVLEMADGRTNANGEKTWLPMLAVGGYTKFVDQGGQQFGMRAPGAKILPIVTITGVYSNIPSDSLLSMALPMAVVAFIMREGYLQPFTRFGKDEVNLGNLILGEDDKPVNLESPAQLAGFCRDILAAPALAIDITNGRARIPGLESIHYDPDRMHTRIAQFLGLDPNAAEVKNILFNEYQEFIGLTSDGQDSRYVDHLNLVAQKVDYRKCRDMLYIPSDPKARGQQISEFAEYTPLFRNICCVLNANYIKQLGTMFSKMQVQWEGNYIDNAGCDLSNLNATYQGMPNFGAQASNPWGPQNFNPYG